VISNGMQLEAIYTLFTNQCPTNSNITCFIDTYGFKVFQRPQGTNSRTSGSYVVYKDFLGLENWTQNSTSFTDFQGPVATLKIG